MSFTTLAKGRYLEALAIDERVVWFSDVILGGVQGLQLDGSLLHGLVERNGSEAFYSMRMAPSSAPVRVELPGSIPRRVDRVRC